MGCTWVSVYDTRNGVVIDMASKTGQVFDTCDTLNGVRDRFRDG
jgi:hypothetical protein